MRTVHGHRISARRRRSTSRARRALQLGAILLALVAVVVVARRGMSTDEPGIDEQRVNASYSFDGRTVTAQRVNDFLSARLGFTSRGGEMRCAYVNVGQEPASGAAATDGRVRLYLEALCLEHVRDGDSLATGSGRWVPAAVSGVIDGDSVRLTDVEVPRDGAVDAAAIRRIFPRPIAQRLLRPTRASLRPRQRMERVLRDDASARLGVRAAADTVR